MKEVVYREYHPLIDGRAALLRLNRPEKMNPLDSVTIQSLNRHLDDLETERDVRAVIVTGEGRAFSAGGDLGGFLSLYSDAARFRAFLDDIRAVFDRLEAGRLVSVAAVNGVCVAGGLELMLACDLAVVSTVARVGDAHLTYWQLPGGGGSQRLPRAVGMARAKRLFYSQELLSAEEAVKFGLAVEAVEPADLVTRALALAGRAATAPEHTVLTLKRMLAVAASEPLSAGLTTEIDVLVDYAAGEINTARQGLARFFAAGTGGDISR